MTAATANALIEPQKSTNVRIHRGAPAWLRAGFANASVVAPDATSAVAAYLFRHAGNLVTREHLLESIWGTRGDLNTRTVDTHISRIRAKLRISPANGWQLSSIYQRGYRLSRISHD